jgi:hypothetical protein
MTSFCTFWGVIEDVKKIIWKEKDRGSGKREEQTESA